MNQTLNKVLTAILVVFGTVILYAQVVPTPPPTPQGPVPGAPSPDTTPIDMYIVYLAIVAVLMIVFYVMKNRKTA